MNKNLKGLIQILFLVILALVVTSGIGYWAYKNGQARLIPQEKPMITPTSTTNSSRDKVLRDWKTYTNEKYRYQVKYPPDWEVTSAFVVSTSESVRFTKIFKENSSYLKDATVDIIVDSNLQRKLPTKEWYLDWIKNIPGDIPDAKGYMFEEVEFIGYTALRVNEQELFFAKDQYMFRITWAVGGDLTNKFKKYTKDISNQILSTFRFLNDPSEASSGGG